MWPAPAPPVGGLHAILSTFLPPLGRQDLVSAPVPPKPPLAKTVDQESLSMHPAGFAVSISGGFKALDVPDDQPDKALRLEHLQLECGALKTYMESFSGDDLHKAIRSPLAVTTTQRTSAFGRKVRKSFKEESKAKKKKKPNLFDDDDGGNNANGTVALAAKCACGINMCASDDEVCRKCGAKRPLEELKLVMSSATRTTTSEITDMAVIKKIKLRMQALALESSGLNMDKLWKSIDKDGSGTLDFTEFKQAFRQKFRIHVREVSDPQLEHFFSLLDEDDSGTVDITELARFATHE